MKYGRKKYNSLEKALQEINREKITLKKEDVRLHNSIMNSVVKQIFEKLKEKDPMINSSRLFYAGSYFCGTRIHLPNEFDIDILLTLPAETEPTLITNVPGYVSVKLENFNEVYLKQIYHQKYSELGPFLDVLNYVQPQKVRDWFKSIVDNALNKFPTKNGVHIVKTPLGPVNITRSESGPAVTLHVSQVKRGIEIDIDLVPSFRFDVSEWKKLYPAKASREIFRRDEFFIVPKCPRYGRIEEYRYWSSSFQEQEGDMIKNLFYLKPAIKLLKLLRDELGQKSIKSYYLKTVVMLMLENKKYDREFWQHNSLSYIFMEVLKFYSTCLENKELPFLWNRRMNLLEQINDEELLNMSQRIKYMIKDINNSIARRDKQAGEVLKEYFGCLEVRT